MDEIGPEEEDYASIEDIVTNNPLKINLNLKIRQRPKNLNKDFKVYYDARKKKHSVKMKDSLGRSMMGNNNILYKSQENEERKE